MLVTHTMDRGGMEEMVLTHARCVDRSKFNVHVVFFVGGKLADELLGVAGISVLHIKETSKWRRLTLLRNAMADRHIDIVSNHFCWYGLLAAFLAGVKRVETIHNTYRWFTMVERIAYSVQCLLANRVIAVSEAVRDFAVRYFEFLDGKIQVIHNGIEQGAVKSHKREVRSLLGIDEKALVVGFVGRLEMEKGVDVLLAAAARLNRLHHNLVFLIVGSGSLEHQLHAEAKQLGLPNVRFLGFRSDANVLYEGMDILVLPSFYEGLPMSILHAMAAGCAVVATGVGGLPEVIEHKVSGMLVKSGDGEGLTRAIDHLIANPAQRDAMTLNARQRVEEKFSARRMVLETEQVYEQLL